MPHEANPQVGTSIYGLNANDNIGDAGRIALSQDGKTLAVGSVNQESGRGVVRIYDRIDNAWVERSQAIVGEQGEKNG